MGSFPPCEDGMEYCPMMGHCIDPMSDCRKCPFYHTCYLVNRVWMVGPERQELSADTGPESAKEE